MRCEEFRIPAYKLVVGFQFNLSLKEIVSKPEL